MTRWLAGIAAVLLLGVGSFLALSGRAEETQLPPAPQARLASASPGPLSPIPNALEADPRNKEERRFGRADKNEDGRISLAELVEPRRKAFAKLDKNGNGALSFDEWAVKTIDKFAGADKDRSGWLDAPEYASTAPPPPKKKRCSC